MRKKSHISLAKFLVNNMHDQDLQAHKKAFYIGSILPDLKPSFFTKHHTIDETFMDLIDEIKKITVDYDINKGINGYYARHLGVVTHYLSDYCTFPHNSVFEGNMREHMHYEKDLKFSLKEYIDNEEVQRERSYKFHTLDEIIHFITRTHKEYMKALKVVHEDILYIINLCYKVVDAILMFLEMALQKLEFNLSNKMNMGLGYKNELGLGYSKVI
jgi:CRISPR/Cas system-associated endoribonuclease Cas2